VNLYLASAHKFISPQSARTPRLSGDGDPDNVRRPRRVAGQRAYKHLLIEVLDHKGIVRSRQNKIAKAGFVWRDEDIQEALELFEKSLEKQFPTVEWRLVELAPNHFKIIEVENESRQARPVESSSAESLQVQRSQTRSPGESGLCEYPNNGPESS
jgi:hypothetical protein